MDEWFALTEKQLPAGRFFLKPGIRGFPDLPPGAESLQKLRFENPGNTLDTSGTAGFGALLAVQAGAPASTVLDYSAVALRCSAATHGDGRTRTVPGFLWDVEPGSVATVISQPPADRGTARVELEIAAAARLLAGGDGRLLLLGHRDQVARRYEKAAAALFRETRVLSRDRGFRLLEARDAHAGPVLPPVTVEFTAAGFELQAVRGTYAAGKLDPGTARLLEALGPEPDFRGREVLDFGCGYGLLALTAARAGAHATAIDDDLAAVWSTRLNAETTGLTGSVTVVHSDLDSALPQELLFDTVLMNPPFHVGRGVRLDLPRAFIRRARQRLRPGGELWLVANRSLPYEPLLSGFSSQELVLDEGGFKVLRAVS